MGSPDTTGGGSITITPMGRRLRTLATVATLVVTLVAGAGMERFLLSGTAFGGQRHESLEDVEEFELLSDVYDYIRDGYIMSDDMSDEELMYGAVSGMLDSLNDADHSYFMDPEDSERNEASTEGELIGIGVRVNWQTIPPRVIYPREDSPAMEAGILPGDEILAIDDVDPSTVIDVEERRLLLRQDEGMDVTLELRHRGETESFTVTITATRMEVSAVSWAMLPGNIQWVRLEDFPDGAADDMRDALAAGRELGAEGVILDLRYNRGGWIDEAIDIAGEFEPEGSVVFQSEEIDGEIIPYETWTTDGGWQEGPLVVLVDAGTASCGEMLSATLKDNNRAILVGQTTRGFGTSVVTFPLEDGSSMNLSIALWLTPDGDVMLNEGISPHVEVANDPGVPFALPFLFDDQELARNDLRDLEDQQLLTAYEIIQDLMAGAS